MGVSCYRKNKPKQMDNQDSTDKQQEPDKFSEKESTKSGEEAKLPTKPVEGNLTKNEKRKIDLSLVVAILALIVSGIQVWISSPQYVKSSNKPELEVREDFRFSNSGDKILIHYFIENISEHTAENVTLRLRIWKDDFYQFVPDIFEVTKDDRNDIPVKVLNFKAENLVAGERVALLVTTDIKNFQHELKVDTLELNKKYEKPFMFIAPEIEMVKCNQGFAKIIREKFIVLNKLNVIEE